MATDEKDRLFESPPSRLWMVDFKTTVTDSEGPRTAPGVMFVNSETLFGACQFAIERYPSIRILGGSHPIDASELDLYSARRL